MTTNIICIINNFDLHRILCIPGTVVEALCEPLTCAFVSTGVVLLSAFRSSRVCAAQRRQLQLFFSLGFSTIRAILKGTQRQGARAAVIAASNSGGNGGEIRT